MREYDSNEPVACTDNVVNSYPTNGEKEYIRPRMDYLREHEITIRFLSVGAVVRVGCKEIAFTSIIKAMEAINDYVHNPKEVTDKYNKLFNEQK